MKYSIFPTLIFILLLNSCKQPTANEFQRSNTNDPNNINFQLSPVSNLILSFTEDKNVILVWEDSTDEFSTGYEISKSLSEDHEFFTLDTVTVGDNNFTDNSGEITLNTVYQVKAIRHLNDTIISADPITQEVSFNGFSEISYEINELPGDSIAFDIKWDFSEEWPFVILIDYMDENKIDALKAGVKNYQTHSFANNFSPRHFEIYAYLNKVDDQEKVGEAFIEYQPAEGQWPDDIDAEIIDEESVQLSWTDNSHMEDSYKIFRSYNDHNNYLEIASLDSNSVSFLDNNIPFVPPTEFFGNYNFKTYYQVRAYKNGTYTGNTTEAQFTIRPPQLNNYTTDENEIKLFWNLPVDDNNNPSPYIKELQVERRVNSGPFIQIDELPSTINSYSDLNLNDSDTYTYRVSTKSGVASNILPFHYAPVFEERAFIEFSSYNSTQATVSLRFSEDDTYLVTANGFFNEDENQEINIIDTGTNSIIYQDNPFRKAVNGVDVHEQTGRVASVSGPANSVKVVDYNTGELIFQKSEVDVFDVVFSPDGQFIYTNSNRGRLMKFDLNSGFTVFDKNQPSITSTIRGMAVSPTGDSIAYSHDGRFRLASSSGADINFNSIDLGSTAQDASFSPNGKYLATVRDFNFATIQKTSDGSNALQVSSQFIDVSNNDHVIFPKPFRISSNLFHYLYYIDLNTKEVITSEPFQGIVGLKFSHKSNFFAVGTALGVHLMSVSDDKEWKLLTNL